MDADGRAAHHPLNEAQRIHAQVVGAAAEGLPTHADVRAHVVRCDQRGLDVLNLTDGATGDLPLDGRDVGAVLVGEGLHQHHMVALRTAEHLLGLGPAGREGLFAEHVLSMLKRTNRPFVVQMIGQRNVHGLDLGVLQELRVASVGAGEAVLLPELLGLLKAPPGNGGALTAVGQLHAPGGVPLKDVRRAHHAPFDLSHMYPPVVGLRPQA